MMLNDPRKLLSEAEALIRACDEPDVSIAGINDQAVVLLGSIARSLLVIAHSIEVERQLREAPQAVVQEEARRQKP